MANPLIKLELMRRFRSQFSAWSIPLLILLPGLAVTLIYATTTSRAGLGGNDFGGGPFGGGDGVVAVSALDGVGVGMFFAVLATLLLSLLLMVPAMVGGSIAGERHNQTLQPLQLTAMGPTQIVAGKLVASVAYLLVLLACAAPVIVIPFLLGGTTATQAVGAYGVLVLVTVEFAAISLALSGIVSRPVPAIMASLFTCAALTIGPWILMGMAFVAASSADAGVDAGESALQLLSTPSPVALGAWVPMGDRGDLDIRSGYPLLASVWYLVVVLGSLWIARSRVTAPVERDR